jgi:hypothetical protein
VRDTCERVGLLAAYQSAREHLYKDLAGWDRSFGVQIRDKLGDEESTRAVVESGDGNEEVAAMSGHLEYLEIDCDAPSYPVVQACARLGFRTPWDVRWLRKRHLMSQHGENWSVFSIRTWMQLLGMHRQGAAVCTCGQDLPVLEPYFLPSLPGGESEYFLGQCTRCRTIFWERA